MAFLRIVLFASFVGVALAAEWDCSTTSGVFTQSTDCVVSSQIVVTGALNITGVPDANGVLPKIIGGGSNRLFKVESGGELVVKYLNLTSVSKQGKFLVSGTVGSIVYFINVNVEQTHGIMLRCFDGTENIGDCTPAATGPTSLTCTTSVVGDYTNISAGGSWNPDLDGVDGLRVYFEAKITEITPPHIYHHGSIIAFENHGFGLSTTYFRNTSCDDGQWHRYELVVNSSMSVVFCEGELLQTSSSHTLSTLLGTNEIYLGAHGAPAVKYCRVKGSFKHLLVQALPSFNPMSCSAAPTQCEDNGYAPYYACIDKPNPNEGVECKPRCPIPTSGSATITSDCILYSQIVVTGTLNVTGIPGAQVTGNATAMESLSRVIGAGQNRHFMVQGESVLLALRWLNMTGGNIFATTGGSVLILSGKLFVYNCIFSKNVAHLGGAIYSKNKESSVFLYETIFESNAAAYGGTIELVYGIHYISDCIFRNNEVTTAGGGIYAFGGEATTNHISPLFLNLTNVTFEYNRQAHKTIHNDVDFAGGGAISLRLKCILIAKGCVFRNNSARYSNYGHVLLTSKSTHGAYDNPLYKGTPSIVLINTNFQQQTKKNMFWGYNMSAYNSSAMEFFTPPHQMHPNPVHLQRVHEPHLHQQTPPKRRSCMFFRMSTRKVWSQRLCLSRLSDRYLWNRGGQNSGNRSLFKLCYWAIQPLYR